MTTSPIKENQGKPIDPASVIVAARAAIQDRRAAMLSAAEAAARNLMETNMDLIVRVEQRPNGHLRATVRSRSATALQLSLFEANASRK